MSNNSDDGIAKGCLAIIFIIVLVAALRELVLILTALIPLLLIIALIGGVGYFVYNLESEGKKEITNFFSKKLTNLTYKEEMKGSEQLKQLSSGREDKLLDTLTSIDSTLSRFNDRMDKQDDRIARLEAKIDELDQRTRDKEKSELNALLKEKPEDHG